MPAPAVRFIDTGAPVAQQTRRLLAAGRAARRRAATAAVALLSSAAPEALDAAAARWLARPAGPREPQPTAAATTA